MRSDRTAGASGRINAPNGIPDCLRISWERGRCFTDILIKLGPVSPSSDVSTGFRDEGISDFAALVLKRVTFLSNFGRGICRGSMRLSLLGFASPEGDLPAFVLAAVGAEVFVLLLPPVGGPLLPPVGGPTFPILPADEPLIPPIGGPTVPILPVGGPVLPPVGGPTFPFCLLTSH